ncbi:MAG: Glycogen synthase [Thermoanaerobacterales bacterium 50_218]|nr:MAG: Glycogen synthase [Thermoanaerobacterales bacterium 50_218]
MMPEKRLKILFASAEVSPFAKTGGLADVAGSLPKALAQLGHDVRVVMPKYKQITEGDYLLDYPVEMDDHLETGILRETRLKGKDVEVPVYLVDNYKYFYRDKIYGYPDEAERFYFFSKSLLGMLPRIEFQPNVIHCNDWHCALIPLLLETKYAEEPFYQHIATLFTIHNLQYQGVFPKDVLRLLGLGEEFFTPERLEFHGKVNFMKSGILHADIINTVSKKYALEIQTPEFGQGLDGLLRRRSQDLYGILNGIDYEIYNPETDPYIYQNYGIATIDQKKENKIGLQKEMELPLGDVPLVGVISRLVAQKGLDLIIEAFEGMMATGIEFVLLGSGEDSYQRQFVELKMKYPRQVAVNLGFNVELAHKIYAGADIFLMPSRFEPCGLAQLISLRYGTIPVVRATGGLADTIQNFDGKKGNGFSFEPYDSDALLEAVKRAVAVYNDHPDQWHCLKVNGMKADHSWSRSASEYLQLYEKAIRKHLSSFHKNAVV